MYVQKLLASVLWLIHLVFWVAASGYALIYVCKLFSNVDDFSQKFDLGIVLAVILIFYTFGLRAFLRCLHQKKYFLALVSLMTLGGYCIVSAGGESCTHHLLVLDWRIQGVATNIHLGLVNIDIRTDGRAAAVLFYPVGALVAYASLWVQRQPK